MFKKFIYPISTLAGTIIGVGVFGLPFVSLKVGFWIILAYFLILGALVILIHLLFGELAIITPDFKRLPGFAKIYLGGPGQVVAYISTILGLFGGLLAYLIVGGEFLAELLRPFLGGEILLYVIIYFTVSAALIFWGIKAIAKVEFWGLVLFLIILFIIFLKSVQFVTIKNLFPEPDWSSLFLPYGIILFSLWGAALIPEAEEMLEGEKKLLKWIIPSSIIIPVIVYLFFIFIVLGITGSQTTQTALPGLRTVLGNGTVSLALLFGLLTTFTSFIALGLTLKKVFWYDLKIPKNYSFVITCFPPLILFLLGMKNFISVISLVGGVMLGIDGILILLMYRKAKMQIPKNKIQNLLVYPLILVLLAGIVYEIIYFIK